MVVLDLFSGAGGLAEGFWRNNCTFVGHVESNKDACDTLRTRSAYWNLKKRNNLEYYYKYLKKEISRDVLWDYGNVGESSEILNEEIGQKTYFKIKKQIKKNMSNNSIEKIDLIIGGPPCQAYSIMGRASLGKKVENDPRNYLYKYYVKFLKDFRPKMFVFENVPGLLSAGNGKYFDDMKTAIDAAGYYMGIKVLVASDFGVLQERKRVIIIGWQKRLKKKCSYPKFEYLDLTKIVPTYLNVFDILNDLPAINPGETIEGEDKYSDSTNDYLIFSKIRSKKFNILSQHIARSHNENDREIYSIAINKWFDEKHRLQYIDLPSRLQKHKNLHANQNRFSVVKANQRFAHTIVAHISVDGHYYIHPDKKQLRSLTVREAARIQSFPDDFYFEGMRNSTFKQIGNAVPPLMAEIIAKRIKEILDVNQI